MSKYSEFVTCPPCEFTHTHAQTHTYVIHSHIHKHSLHNNNLISTHTAHTYLSGRLARNLRGCSHRVKRLAIGKWKIKLKLVSLDKCIYTVIVFLSPHHSISLTLSVSLCLSLFTHTRFTPTSALKTNDLGGVGSARHTEED